MKYAFIHSLDNIRFPVAWCCRQLDISRSSFYLWRKHQAVVSLNSYKQRRHEYAEVIKQLFVEQRFRAGARTITALMNRAGHACSTKLVASIMREQGLVAVQPRAYKRTTIPGRPCEAVDQLEQNFDPADYVPGEHLCGDITYLKTATG